MIPSTSATLYIRHCTSSYAQTYKRRLIHAGGIEQKRRGEVSFAVRYLRDYLISAYADM